MSAGDTAFLDIQVAGSTKTVGMVGTDVSGQIATFFSGVLVC
jgi:hypothetical protein